MTQSLLARSIAELIGTAAIIFFGCGAIILHEMSLVSPMIIAPVFGFAVMAMIYTFGHISGAHFNPAVTIAFAYARHFRAREVLTYSIAQVLGATLGAVLLWILFPVSATYGASIPTVAPGAAFMWEVVLTFFLMIVVMAVATDTRAEGTMAGAAVGVIIMLGAYLGGWAGVSMNPARTIGPAIVSGKFEGFWIYLVGPIVGALLGAIVYLRLARAESPSAPR
jgi:aquaporin NIP